MSLGTLALAFLQLQILHSMSTQLDSKGRLVRREDKSILERDPRVDSLQQGEMAELVDSLEKKSATNAVVDAGTMDEATISEVVMTTQVPFETCNDDFPLGIQHTNRCQNATHHRQIFDEGMCLKASDLAGARIEHNFFVIERKYRDLHPLGCFAYHCGHTALNQSLPHDNQTEICYYFNGNGAPPSNPHGFPVCFRADYLNGTVDTNGGCDKHYEVVMDEHTCEAAAECLGMEKEHEFRIGEQNWTKHLEYPKGCFIRKDTGAFQFNDISTLNGSEPPNPHIGGGIPVCNVSSTVHWPNGGEDALTDTNYPR